MPGLNEPKDPLSTVNPTLVAKQDKLEGEEAEPVVVEAKVETEVTEDAELEALSVKELQAVVTRLGFAGAEVFDKKKQLIKVIHNIKSKPSFSAHVTQRIENPTEAKNWEGKRERTKAFMEKQPTIRTMIPLDLGEKIGAVAELQINGYKMIVPKGKYCNLPQPFADLVAYSYNQTAEAGKEFELDRPGTDPETGKTVAEVLA